MAMKIRKIEARKLVEKPKQKVAAYARVSMVTDRLEHSLSAQVSYYSELIQNNPDWEFAGIYADNGISGTTAKGRGEFQRLIADCEAGLIDIVLTKSISRFARNTLDLLNTVRHLKEIGVEVWFEKEHIHTFSNDGELMLSLLASFAQNESENISNNVKWGIRKRFEQGIPNGRFRIYGYRWKGDELLVVPKEAEVVKRIFQNFLDGKSRLETEREFAAEGITTRAGYRWVDSNIKNVLSNVNYTGVMVLQKEFTDGPLGHKRRKNNGNLPQYLVPNHHEPIIDKATFDYVQAEIARRRELGPLANKSLNTSCFTGKIKCVRCGKSFMHNIGHISKATGEQYITWVCGTKKRKGGRCPTKEIPDKVLRRECAAVLGLAEFEEQTFTEQVERIEVPEHHMMVVVFKDGRRVERRWKSTAKKDCWTEEYKDRQRQWVRNYMAKGEGRFSAFTTRIKCGKCGVPFRRQTRKYANGKRSVWVHIGRGFETCGMKNIYEERLIEAAAKAMDLPEFDAEQFIEQVDRITVDSPTDLTFYFKDGREVHEIISDKRIVAGWTPERRVKQTQAIRDSYTPERRKRMSERMKELRSQKYWNSKGGGSRAKGD